MASNWVIWGFVSYIFSVILRESSFFLLNNMDYYKRKNRFLAIEKELNRKMTYAIIKRLCKDK